MASKERGGLSKKEFAKKIAKPAQPAKVAYNMSRGTATILKPSVPKKFDAQSKALKGYSSLPKGMSGPAAPKAILAKNYVTAQKKGYDTVTQEKGMSGPAMPYDLYKKKQRQIIDEEADKYKKEAEQAGQDYKEKKNQIKGVFSPSVWKEALKPRNLIKGFKKVGEFAYDVPKTAAREVLSAGLSTKYGKEKLGGKINPKEDFGKTGAKILGENPIGSYGQRFPKHKEFLKGLGFGEKSSNLAAPVTLAGSVAANVVLGGKGKTAKETVKGFFSKFGKNAVRGSELRSGIDNVSEQSRIASENRAKISEGIKVKTARASDEIPNETPKEIPRENIPGKTDKNVPVKKSDGTNVERVDVESGKSKIKESQERVRKATDDYNNSSKDEFGNVHTDIKKSFDDAIRAEDGNTRKAYKDVTGEDLPEGTPIDEVLRKLEEFGVKNERRFKLQDSEKMSSREALDNRSVGRPLKATIQSPKVGLLRRGKLGNNVSKVSKSKGLKSKNIVDAFDSSTEQKDLGKIGNVRYEIGSLGRNQGARKTGQVDRFSADEIGDTLKNVKKSFRASNDPKNYRFDNVAHIAEMPNGEKRVVYTRKNKSGAEEVINWHKIDETKNPNYLKQLESFGSPDGNRTHILDLEGQRSNPLAYGAETSIAPNGGKVNPTIQEGTRKGLLTVAREKNMKQAIVKNFDPKSYVKEMKTAQKNAEGKGGLLVKAQNFLSEFKKKIIDSNAPIEDVIAQQQKKLNFESIPRYDMTNAIDRVYRSNSIAGEFARKNGLEDVIKKVDDLDEFDQYLIAKHGLSLRAEGIETGRDALKDELLIRAVGDKYKDAEKVVRDYSHKLMDYAVESGLVSKETAKILREKYPDYVPYNRIFGEDEAVSGIGRGRSVANLGKQTVVRGIKGSEREVQSPMRSFLERTAEAFTQGEKNKAAQILTSYHNLPDNPFGLEAIRTVENVKKRIEVLTELRKMYRGVRDEGVVGIKQQRRQLQSANRKVRGILTDVRGVERKINETEAEALSHNFDESIVREDPYITDNFRTLASKNKQIGSLNLQIKAVNNQTENVLDEALTRSADFEANSTLDSLAFKLESVEKRESALRVKASKLVDEEAQMRQDIRVKRAIQRANVTKDFTGKLLSLENRKGYLEDKAFFGKQAEIAKELDAILQEKKGIVTQLRQELASAKDAPKSPGDNTISVFKDGVKEIWKVDKDIAEAAKALNVQQIGLLGKIFVAPVRVAKLGITGINLPFVAANVARDIVSAAINSKHPLRSLLSMPQALFEAVGHQKLYKEMTSEGALQTSFDIARNQVSPTIRDTRGLLKNKGIEKVKYIASTPAKLFRAVEDIIGRSEELNRISQYKGAYDAAISKGMQPIDARAVAARSARENSVNFARKGEIGQAMNALVLYLNAGIQGSRTLVRSIKTRPVPTSAKIVTVVGMPLAITTSWNLSDPKRKAAYEDIPEYEKENNFILIPDNPTQDENGKWNVIKVPIQPGLSNLVQPIRHFLERASDIDSKSLLQIASHLTGSVSPIQVPVDLETGSNTANQLIPQALKPTVEAMANQNFFTGAPIVPRRLEGLEPELQVKDNTSGTSMLIGKRLGVSPLQVEQFIKGTFGSVGLQVLNASDNALAKTGKISPEDIGGQKVFEAVFARFGKAQGGAIENAQWEKKNKEDIQRKSENFVKQKTMLPKYEEAKALLESGKEEEYVKLRESLSEEDQKTFKSVQQSERKKFTNENKEKLKPLAQQIKSLAEQEKWDEAEKMFQGLSKDEQRVVENILDEK